MNRRTICRSFLAIACTAIFIKSSTAKNSPYFAKYVSEKELKNYARAISVRVFPTKNPHYGGSGVLIQRDNHLYTVVTNDHVINNKKQSYKIQTSDNKVYSADILKLAKSDADIGFLVFFSPDFVYTVATTVKEPTVQKKTLVIAGGFPFSSNLKQSGKFKTNKGLIAEVLNRPFIGGYQIGYSNAIVNGMSGGPLLNYYGELIGINGTGQEPLFGNPYVFEDGSTISEAEWNIFSRLSWAIPIQIIQRMSEKSK